MKRKEGIIPARSHKEEPLAAATAPLAAHSSPPSSASPTTAQVFLGIFVLWQLFFLFTYNFVTLGNDLRKEEDYKKKLPRDWKGVIEKTFPDWFDKKGHFHDVCAAINGLNKRWSALGGQPQGWSLFAPEISKQITFVAVELRWDEPERNRTRRRPMAPFPPELLLSENEPKDKAQFFRLGKFRLRKYESYLDTVLRKWDDETLQEAVERWGDRIRKKVKDEDDNILAYLQMRWEEYSAEHPARPMPRQAILLVRRFEIPEPQNFSEDWYKDPRGDPQRQLPIARSLIDSNGGWGAVEWYRPRLARHRKITGRFLKLGDNDDRSRREAEDDDDDD
jgi:hypothetical protein